MYPELCKIVRKWYEKKWVKENNLLSNENFGGGYGGLKHSGYR